MRQNLRDQGRHLDACNDPQLAYSPLGSASGRNLNAALPDRRAVFICEAEIGLAWLLVAVNDTQQLIA